MTAFEEDISLVFTGGQLLLRQPTANGTELKYLSASSVRAAFSTELLDSAWLPHRVCRMGWSAAGEWLVLHNPPQRYTITLSPVPLVESSEMPPRRISIPLPGFLFLGIQEHYFIWAVRGNTPAKAKAYRAPVPNVHDSGAICFGEHRPPRASAKTMDAAWHLFWNTPFNDHLIAGKSHRQPTDVRRTWLTLTNRRTRRYPSETLVSVNTPFDRLIAQAINQT